MNPAVPDCDRGLVSCISFGLIQRAVSIMDTPGVHLGHCGHAEHITPLQAACALATPDVAKILLSRAEVDPNETNGTPPLHIACSRFNTDIAQLLLEHPRINPKIKDPKGKTALHVAAENDSRQALLLLLDDGRISVEEKDNEGCTALDLACRAQAGRVAQYLAIASPVLEIEAAWPCDCKHPQDCANFFIGEYLKNPSLKRRSLQAKWPGVLSPEAGLFAKIIFLCDGLVELTPEEPSPARRFFEIARRLPMEVQMILCNVTAGTPFISIPLDLRERAFRQLARKFEEAN